MPVASSARLRRARWATTLMFFTNGALFANLLPRYPSIKEAAGLSNTGFGLLVIAFPLGAILAGLASAALIRRIGAGNLAALTTALVAAGLIVVGWSTSIPLLAVALLVAGAMDAITDVAQNSHGLWVQRGYGRTLINSFHATWSAGAVTGGAMGTFAAARDLPLGWHLTVSGIVWVLIALVARALSLSRSLTSPAEVDRSRLEAEPAGAAAEHPDAARADSAHDNSAGGRTLKRSAWVLAALVMVAAAGTLVEDSGNTWSAVFLRSELGASAALAGAGYVALTGAQFIGRLVGDPLSDRLGQRAVARIGAVLIVAGMLAVVFSPAAGFAIAGFAVAGYGSATLVPAAMQAADALPGHREGSALSLVSWLMRLAFLASPPIVGALGDAAGLRVGLAVVPVLALFAIAAAGQLTGRERNRAQPI